MNHKLAMLMVILIFGFTCEDLLTMKITAQERELPKPQGEISQRIDLIEYAATLAFNAGLEASSLSNPAEKIERQLEAARLLASLRPHHALRLLDAAWTSLKDWIEGEKTAGTPPQLAFDLRGDILALYSKLNPESANKLAASLSDNKEINEETKARSPLPSERQRADEIIKLSFTKLKQSPNESIEAALSSLEITGKVSEYLSSLAEVLYEKGDKSLLQRLESKLALLLAGRSSLDPHDHRAIMLMLNVDPQMPSSTRLALLGFLTRSLQKLVDVIREAQISKQPLLINIDVATFIHSIHLRYVRPLVVKYAPDQINKFDSLLSGVTAAMPTSYLDEIYEASTTDSVEDQLARARKTADRNLRDSRLASFFFRALIGKLPAPKERQLELATTAAGEIEDSKIKETLQEYILMAEVRELTAQKSFGMAVEKASKISNLDWRAWTLLAIASAEPEQNWSETIQIYESALRTLEKSSPSARKTELAFLAAELLSKLDQLRAFEVMTFAVKYANQVSETDFVNKEHSTNLNRFFPQIGKLSFAPGEEPESLDEVGFGEGVSRLAYRDWTQAVQIGKAIQNTGLRLRYQLAMCKGILLKLKAAGKS